MSSTPNHAAVVGGGLVGTLCAAMLSARGWSVTLFEARPDPRLQLGSASSRSINLALSPRGIEALRSVSEELADRVVREGVRMRGRMVHKKEGKSAGQDYGVYEEGEFISSISRSVLGIYLLDHLDGLPKAGKGAVKVVFESKMLEMDLRTEQGVNLVVDSKADGKQKLHFDFVIGGDGAYSKVRREMMRGTRFNYSQSYAKHSYLELTIPAAADASWSIEPDYLHIWPRGEFMLIALPNQDKSFTLTLFAHTETFDSLDAQLKENNPAKLNPVVELFRTEFADAYELMGKDGLMKSWTENPKDGLITVECSPYHYEDKALLIGDAAHAMVPFYGQGMNCAFEDVRVLSSVLDHFAASPSDHSPYPLPLSTVSPALKTFSSSNLKAEKALAQAFEAYTTIRLPSLLAIQQLAASNYAEMASSVLDPFYLFRLALDGLVSRFFSVVGTKKGGGQGGPWESLYRMVTFRYGLAYEEALVRRDWQGRVLAGIAKVGLGVATVGAAAAVYTIRARRTL